MAHSARDLRRDCYAAVDIGASSGRVVVGFVEDGRIHLEEVHRFDNRQVRRGGHDCWDIDLLYGELVRGLALCKEAGFAPKSVGIDTWASISSCWMLTTTWWATPWPIATSALRACSRWPTPS